MRAALAALLLSTSISAAGPTWSVARSSHFEVYTTGASARATEALVMFEQARAFFAAYLALPDSPRPPIRVLVFSGQKEYAPYAANPSTAAFFQPGRRRDFIVLKEFGGDSFRIVAHEYAHVALGLKGADLPPWLSEGLAEFFSSVSIDGGKARIGREPDGRLRTLANARLMKVAELIAVRRDSDAYNLSDEAGLFYAQSWALTHMLLIDERYKKGTPQLIALTQSGMHSDVALSQVYGKTTAEIDKDLRNYVSRASYRFVTIEFHPPAAPPASAPEVVAPFDASLAIAEMLSSQTGKHAETRALLDTLAREQPDSLAVVELRAYFELRTLGIAAAEPYFRVAVDRGSKDASVLAEYALRIAGQEPDRASELITRAMVLAPDDIEIRVHAAAVMIQRQLPKDAMALLAPIGRVPSNLEFECYQIVANVHTMMGEFPEAAAAAAQVLAAAVTPQQVNFATALVKLAGGPADMSRIVEGRVKNLDCDASTPVLEVLVGDRTLKLAIDDSSQIVIAGGGKLDLDCGAQDVQVRVGYAEATPPAGTVGRVRFLDFRKKTPQS